MGYQDDSDDGKIFLARSLKKILRRKTAVTKDNPWGRASSANPWCNIGGGGLNAGSGSVPGRKGDDEAVRPIGKEP